MKRKFSKFIALFLALILIASIPLNAFAAPYYNNKSTVPISCKSTKTYYFSTSDNSGASLAGNIKFKKGGVTSADSVSLTTLDPMYGNVRYMRVSITTTDNKTHTVQKKIEKINGTKTKVTITEDGKITSQKTYSVLEYHNDHTITVKGTLWKAAKSIYASTNVTGGSSNCYLYFKT